MSQSIAVINAGSSSIKFALYDAAIDQGSLFSGQVEGIGVKPRLKIADANGRVLEERDFDATQGFDHDSATREIIAIGRTLLKERSAASNTVLRCG